MILIIVRPTLEYSRLLKAGGVPGLEDLVHVFFPFPCTGWGKGQFYEVEDDHDVEKDDKKDKKDKKDVEDDKDEKDVEDEKDEKDVEDEKDEKDEKDVEGNEERMKTCSLQRSWRMFVRQEGVLCLKLGGLRQQR